MPHSFENQIRACILKHSAKKLEFLRQKIEHEPSVCCVETGQLVDECYGFKRSKKMKIAFSDDTGTIDITDDITIPVRYNEAQAPCISKASWEQICLCAKPGSKVNIIAPQGENFLLVNEITYRKENKTKKTWWRNIVYANMPEFLIFPGLRNLVANDLSKAIDHRFHQAFNQVVNALYLDFQK